jgi:hypothetical protein
MNKSTSKKQGKEQVITRKQAIKKAGYSVLTATTLLFLSTKQSSAGSPI